MRGQKTFRIQFEGVAAPAVNYTPRMQPERIAALLSPFLPSSPLSPLQLEQVSNHLELLLQWNARINLTSVRTPEEIIARHFGESFFLAQTLFPLTAADASQPAIRSAIDLGSGAGFPGLPLKIWVPELPLVLIESQSKKATFLKEVIRKNTLMDINVFSNRAETFVAKPPAPGSHHHPAPAALVTMRAVERFADSLPIAASLLAPAGTLTLLIGAAQVSDAASLAPSIRWSPPIPVPLSRSRILLLGQL